uniref:Uncharacterized protein n=1 Tax=Rhizophora mucronata TaxID=61149 RepID=A0A2P2PQ63_RHIMU
MQTKRKKINCMISLNIGIDKIANERSLRKSEQESPDG